jgi:hypothetical protein
MNIKTVEYKLKSDNGSIIELPAKSFERTTRLMQMIYSSDSTEDLINHIYNDSYFKQIPQESILKIIGESDALRRAKSGEFNARRFTDDLHIKLGLLETGEMLNSKEEVDEKILQLHVSLKNTLKSL